MAGNFESLVFRLFRTPGFGPARLRAVLRKIDLDKTEQYGPEDIESLLAPPELEGFKQTRSSSNVEWEQLQENQVHTIPYFSSLYPSRLRKWLGDKSPPLLFVMAQSNLLDRPSIGFCGSRQASQKGIETGEDCAEQFVEAGINIVSGYARGIDMHVHHKALEKGGTTTIVLPEGILNFRIKAELESVWDWSRVVVVSEFSPTRPWSVGGAMQRNATMCALSDAMILIEARTTGGSIAAGKSCLRLGIPLFAAVYGDAPDEAGGNEQLLREGARPLKKSRSTERAGLKSVFEILRPISRTSDEEKINTDLFSRVGASH
jgi:DNA processing protein